MQSLAKEHHIHLTDANEYDTATIDSVFWELVDCRDDKLGSILRSNMLADNDVSSFVAGWITSWFASALPTGLVTCSVDATGASSISSVELEVASRFIDVFLCSHPFMPIYVAVALVMHPVNRSQVVSVAAGAEDATFTSSLSLADLPRTMMASILGITDEVFFDGNRYDGVENNGHIADDRRAELMSVVEEIIADGIELM